ASPAWMTTCPAGDSSNRASRATVRSCRLLHLEKSGSPASTPAQSFVVGARSQGGSSSASPSSRAAPGGLTLAILLLSSLRAGWWAVNTIESRRSPMCSLFQGPIRAEVGHAVLPLLGFRAALRRSSGASASCGLAFGTRGSVAGHLREEL